jgi:hypothetical protein
MNSILDRLEIVASGLNEFDGKKSVTMTLTNDELASLCSEIEEEYGANSEVVYGKIDTCCKQTNIVHAIMFRGIYFYFGVV